MSNLSQNEIDALIRSLGPPRVPLTGAGGVPGPGLRALRRSKPYRIYDFRRPDKLSKEQIRLLRTVFNRFPRAVTSYLANLTRTSVDTSLMEVDQTTYSEIFKTHGIPTLMCTFAIGEDMQGMIKINLNQLFAILDRLMGGPGSGTILSRPLTDFERGLMGDICQQLLVFYQQEVSIESEVSLENLDTDERVMARILSADEIMVRALYDLRLGGTTGHLSIYTPLGSLAPILGRLSSGERRRHPIERKLPPSLATLPLPVAVELGSTLLPASRVTELRPGDVLTLNQRQNRPLRITVGGVPRFGGRPGTLERRLAVVIEGAWKEGNS